MTMESLGRLLLITAAILAAAGVLILLATKLGVTRLPGDIVIRRDNLTVYFPLGLMIALSVIVSLLLYLLRRL